MNKALKDYECEGQLSIFDIPIKEPELFMNPPEEPIYKLDIKGICDDPYCPQCGYEFETTRTCKNYEVDCERCPECHVKVDWGPWHRLND